MRYRVSMSSCKKCRKAETEVEFYAGVQTYCKECWKERVRKRRKENPKVQEYDRKRSKKKKRRKHLTRNMRAWRKANPQGYKAHSKLAHAVRAGKIEKASHCERCGKDCTDLKTEPHGHHEDYSKPFDVEWLCARCHCSELRRD